MPDMANYPSNVTSQRKRLLDAFRLWGYVTTVRARQELDVLHPAARIQELRRMGYQIDTYWTSEATLLGQRHRVARYVLQPTSKPSRAEA